MKIFISILFFCLCFSSSIAQNAPYFLQSHLNGESGLPQNTVRDMHFSKTGFLWIATENGLSRFDGKNIKNYYAGQNGLVKNRIGQFILMNDQSLYCLAEGELLHQIVETKNETSIHLAQQIKKRPFISYHSFQADSLEHFHNICNSAITENLLANQCIFYVLTKQKLYAQRSSKGIILFSATTCIPFKTVEIKNNASNTYFIQNDELYFKSTQNDFFHINTLSGEITKLKSNIKFTLENQSRSNQHDLNNLFWNYKTKNCFFVDQQSLYEVCIHDDRVEFDKKINELPLFKISAICYSPDKQSILVGTFSNGLFWYKKKKFDIKLSSFGDNTFYAHTNSQLEAAIFAPEPAQIFYSSHSSKVPCNHVINNITLFTDHLNRIWLAKSDTVLCYDFFFKKKYAQLTIPDNGGLGIGFIAARDSLSIYISSNDALFIYSFGGNLKKVGEYPSQKKIDRTYTICKDGDSLVYVGTDQGLIQYNTMRDKLEPCCLNGMSVRSLFKTTHGTILAGTYGNGFYAINNHHAIAIPLDKNGNLKSTHSFIEDHRGYLWMTTNNGLYKVKLSEIENYILSPDNRIIYYYRYSHTDGLLTNEFNGGCHPNAVRVDSSTWSLPSMQGLVWFQPDSLSNGFENTNLFIDKIQLNDKLLNLPIDQTIHTQKHSFRLAFFVTAPNWTDEANLYIEYAIDPSTSNSNWILLKDNETPIILQNLSGGNHTLVIRKKIGDDENHLNQIELKIHVPKLLNEYAWFWPITICLLLMLIYGVTKFATLVIARQKIQLEKKVLQKTLQLQDAVNTLEQQNITIQESKIKLTKENELKSTLLFLLSHDIASPLRFINRFLSGIANSTEISQMSHEDLIDLTISTQNLESLLDNIVTWIQQNIHHSNELDISTFPLAALIDEKIKLFQLAIKKKRNQCSHHISPTLTLTTNRFIISMAIQNLLGNAVNYTKNGNIQIEYTETNTTIEISVIDSGAGQLRLQINETNEAMAGYGIGLKITNELLKLIDGEIQLLPLKNNGGMKASIYIRKK